MAYPDVICALFVKNPCVPDYRPDYQVLSMFTEEAFCNNPKCECVDYVNKTNVILMRKVLPRSVLTVALRSRHNAKRVRDDG